MRWRSWASGTPTNRSTCRSTTPRPTTRGSTATPTSWSGCTTTPTSRRSPREEPHPWVEPRKADFADAFADPHPHLAGYCASLTAVDEGLGLIRARLTELGLSGDTVVVYMSDNGFSCGHHGIWGKGNGTWPLNFWDNSVRVPFVIHVPDGARGSTDELVPSVALHPTICDLAGITPPADQWAAGRSVAPLLHGAAGSGHETVVVHAEYGGGRMITDGRWKYVHRADGPDELYDRAADPGERVNLVDDPAAAGERDRLAADLAAWFAEHERAGMSGFDRAVSGHGQVHPLSRGLPEEETWARA